MLENEPEQIDITVPVLSTWWDVAVHSKATRKLIHIAENMLLKGLWSLSVCLKKVSSLISKKLPLPCMKRSHCQISSVCTQGLLEKCPTEFVRIATKKFLYARRALALKFTILRYLQKKTIYLSNVVLENPHWNLSCITKIHQFSFKEQREAKSLQNRNKHTNLIQGWFRSPWHHSVFLALDNSSQPHVIHE